MDRDIYNPEGYPDPTAYQALANVAAQQRKQMFRPVVYICSPYAGDTQKHTADARRFCRFAVDSGAIPLAPHLLLPQFMDDASADERELAMFMDLVLLTKCAELWVFGDAISPGMAREIRKAEARNMQIRYFTTECKEDVHQ